METKDITIAVSADHRGFRQKEYIKSYLINSGYNVIDCGTESDDKVDYPKYGKIVAELTVHNEANLGVSVCGSGIGVTIAANKVKGARAVNVNNEELAKMSRMHNNANVICFGSDFVTNEDAIKYLKIFIETPFDIGERHHKRVDMLDEM